MVANDRGGLSRGELAAWRGLLLMHARVTAELNRQLAGSGLTLQDYELLASLDEGPAGTRRPYELAEALGLEKTRLSHHVARLERRGWVARRPCPTDRRGWLIGITPPGRRALDAAAPGHVAAVRATFLEKLSAAQLSALRKLVSAVLGAPNA